MSGYNPQEDGSFGGWFVKWFFIGLMIAIGFCVYLAHLANKQVEENLPSKRQGTHQTTEPVSSP